MADRLIKPAYVEGAVLRRPDGWSGVERSSG
jgi:hypothetical protein